MDRSYCPHCMEHLEQGSQFCPHCKNALPIEVPSHHLKPLSVLQEKYLVGCAIGEGGFGITYIGRDLILDMPIAVKEYYPNGYSNRNHLFSNTVTLTQAKHESDYARDMQRFLHEARILAKFSGEPGVVGVRDFFQENGTAYIVMEYLDGMTLKEYLHKYGPIPAETLFQMMRPIMLALSEMHKQGLIHRDISPDNIMLLNNGQLKLLDFGAAREVVGGKSLSIMLKPGYAPEEQYRTKGQQGAWTDIYAMCATMYKCITGITPDESVQRVFKDELKPPSKLGIPISPQKDAVLMHGMAVKYQDRFQTMEAFIKALDSENAEDTRTIHISRQGQLSERRKKPAEPDSDKTVYQEQRRAKGGNSVNIASSPRREKSATDQTNLASAHQSTLPVAERTDSTPTPNSREQLSQNGKSREQKINPRPSTTRRRKKPQRHRDQNHHTLKITVLILSVVAILVVGILLFFTLTGGNTGHKADSLADSLPTERTMLSHCAQALRSKNIDGSILGISVDQENLNERFKTYVVTCSVRVKEETETSYVIELQYEYDNGSWILRSQNIK